MNNKLFRKTIKPLLSDQKKSSEKITLVEGNKSFAQNAKKAEILNTFFSNPA